MSDSKTVLVIGASRGLGLALAEEFCSRGWRVIATERAHSVGLAALAAQATHGRCCWWLQGGCVPRWEGPEPRIRLKKAFPRSSLWSSAVAVKLACASWTGTAANYSGERQLGALGDE